LIVLITLLTDFGTADTYVAQMKGVILGIAPGAALVDLTHEVPPQDIAGGALLLATAAAAFGPDTVHLAVVDPGVGSTRRGVAIQTRRGMFVGPDNGLFSLVLDRFVRGVSLTNSAFHREPVSPTFHGRDVFAPVAAHLARATRQDGAAAVLDELGEPLEAADLVRLPDVEPTPLPGAGTGAGAKGLQLTVLHIDRFGNLVTNLALRWFERWLDQHHQGSTAGLAVRVGSRVIRELDRTFADVEVGAPVAYFGSSGRLEIAVRNDNAARVWGVRRGDHVDLGDW
jgi:S-adenosylmethionine hydrolase